MKRLAHITTYNFLLLPFLIMSQAGTLDTDFNTNGYVVTGSNGITDVAKAVAIQADGKIVTAGFTGINTSANFDLHRFNQNGSLDPTFGNNGRVGYDFAGNLDAAWGIAIQPDGKILAAGLAFNFTQRFGLIRFNSDGSLDNSFATQGVSTVNFGGINDQGLAMTLQSDGKIIVAGGSNQGGSDSDFAIARWKTDGTIDSSFSTQGTLVVDVGTENGTARSVLVQPDGKIVMGGFSQNSSNWAFQLVRLNSDGTLDDSFNGSGKLRIEINSMDDACRALALQADGKIIAVGYSLIAGQYDLALVRVNSDGTLDDTFSSDGIATIPVGAGLDLLNSVYLQEDGRIVCTGTSDSGGSNFNALVMRLNSNGTMDNSFGTNGLTTTSLGFDEEEINHCSPDASGNIVGVGYHRLEGTQDLQVMVLRYLNDLNIGIIEQNNSNINTFIYPNPLSDSATLEFELQSSSPVSIELLDLQGRLLHVFQQAVFMPDGEQCVRLEMPDILSKGSYLIRVSTDKGSVSVRIVK